jgi:hypothetical protein
LESALETVSTLRAKLGDGPYSREQAAIELGYSGISGISSTKIAACAHFGLLDKSGGVYLLSELAKRIIASTSDEERRVATVEAAKTPTLYAKLISAYGGQALPTSLNNILDRQYGIISKKAEIAARLFKESIEFAGILRNGVVFVDGYNDSSTTTDLSKQDDGSAEKTSNTNGKKKSLSEVEFTIPGTEIRVVVPEKYAYALATGEFSDSIRSIKDKVDELNGQKSLAAEDNNSSEL